jgi:hypothetical protein
VTWWIPNRIGAERYAVIHLAAASQAGYTKHKTHSAVTAAWSARMGKHKTKMHPAPFMFHYRLWGCSSMTGGCKTGAKWMQTCLRVAATVAHWVQSGCISDAFRPRACKLDAKRLQTGCKPDAVSLLFGIGPITPSHLRGRIDGPITSSMGPRYRRGDPLPARVAVGLPRSLDIGANGAVLVRVHCNKRLEGRQRLWGRNRMTWY